MDKFTEDAKDALQQHEDTAQRRTRFPRLRPAQIAGTWAPTMTEQERAQHEQYVKDNDLPF